MSVIFKNTEIQLYTNRFNYDSYSINIALNEKNITPTFIFLDENDLPESFLELNNYAVLPTLIDRDLVIYNADIILNYLDERFPHPPLLPVEPITRTKLRLLIYRVQQDWLRLATVILTSESKERQQRARDLLQNQLISISPNFAENEYFAHETFSLLDCIVAPLLANLSDMGIILDKTNAKDLLNYMDRLFSTESVKNVHSDLSAIKKDELENL